MSLITTGEPKEIRFCDLAFQTKIMIVGDSFFRKTNSILYCISPNDVIMMSPKNDFILSCHRSDDMMHLIRFSVLTVLLSFHVIRFLATCFRSFKKIVSAKVWLRNCVIDFVQRGNV